MKSNYYIPIGNLLRQGFTLLTTLIIAEKLGKFYFGEFTVGFAFYFILAGLSDFGTRIYSWKEAINHKNDKVQLSILIFDRFFLSVFL